MVKDFNKISHKYWYHSMRVAPSDTGVKRVCKRIVWYFCPIFYKYNVEAQYRTQEHCLEFKIPYYTKNALTWSFIKYPWILGYKKCIKFILSCTPKNIKINHRLKSMKIITSNSRFEIIS